MCAGCKEPIEIEDMKLPQIMNTATASVLLLEHPEQTLCPRCNRPVAAFLSGANLMVIAAPVEPKAQKRIILAPGGVR